MDKVDIYLDCLKADTEPIDVRGRIDTNGEILLGKSVKSGETVQVSRGTYTIQNNAKQ